MQCAPDEGFYPRAQTVRMRDTRPPRQPLTRPPEFTIGRRFRADPVARPPSPTRRGEGAACSPHCVIEIGEKSTNQLLGCTKPFIFGLMARGATSWAT